MSDTLSNSIEYEMISELLYDNYECVYAVDLTNDSYTVFHESELYKTLEIKKHGDDFFEELRRAVPKVIVSEDIDYVSRMMSKEALIRGVQLNKNYTLTYRIVRDRKEVFHKMSSVMKIINDRPHIFIGIRDVDDEVRQEMDRRHEIESMRQREINHMQAVLTSAAAYMEANLSRDLMIEKSDDRLTREKQFIKNIPPISDLPSYSMMHRWICENLIADNKEQYEKTGSIRYLLDRFMRGLPRTQVSFSVITKDGDLRPCREEFFIYEEMTTHDIRLFCVIYDLSEDQQKEKELHELENELSMSRLRNLNNQVKPHFLYSSLGSIQEIILTDPQYASELLGHFARHLRSYLNAMKRDDQLSFSQELENITAYINIEKMRLGNKLTVQYEIETDDFSIIPLTIQPLVENAIRHGVYPKGTGGGTVTIRSKEEASDFIIEIEDDGIGFDVENAETDSGGIYSSRQRLEKIMNAKLEIKSEPGKGTLVSIHIPKDAT